MLKSNKKFNKSFVLTKDGKASCLFIMGDSLLICFGNLVIDFVCLSS